jgi:hypothetical protein
MEGLSRLVTESLARNGVETSLDHRRLQWSRWLRCESSFSTLLIPSKPGLYALGQEVIAPGELPVTGGKRMLALFRISETEDLGMALGRLFLPGAPDRERFAAGNCFARYAVIEDVVQRRAAHSALQQWLASSAETVSGVTADLPAQSAEMEQKELSLSNIGPPAPLPSGF